MKPKKAISWEKLSEGTVTASEIYCLQAFRQPIHLFLSPFNASDNFYAISIFPVRGPAYNISNQITGVAQVNKKPYKYLSCAVRRAVREYKTVLRSGKWKIHTKV